MKTLLFSSLFAFLPAFAGPCPVGTLETYLDLAAAGCDLGNTTFRNFMVAPGQSFAVTIDPALIQVTPVASTYTSSLTFTFQQPAGAGELFESFFRFNVVGSGLTGAGVTLDSPNATGDGVVTAILDICPGGSFSGDSPLGCSHPAATPIAVALEGFSQLSDSATFTPGNFFDVFTNFTVDGGVAGSASFGSATVDISAVPEPASVLFIITGAALIALGRTRRDH